MGDVGKRSTCEDSHRVCSADEGSLHCRFIAEQMSVHEHFSSSGPSAVVNPSPTSFLRASTSLC